MGSGGRAEARAVIVNDGGRLSGNGGTVAANVVLDGGTIAPGTSPGIMSIDGNLDVQDGLLEFEVAGTAPGAFDQLFVSGDLFAPNGLSISISFLDGFVPQPGDSFDFLGVAGSAAILGTPERILVSVLGIDAAGFGLSFNENGFGGTFTGEERLAPVPVPVSFPLLLAALGLLGVAARGRGAGGAA